MKRLTQGLISKKRAETKLTDLSWYIAIALVYNTEQTYPFSMYNSTREMCTCMSASFTTNC